MPVPVIFKTSDFQAAVHGCETPISKLWQLSSDTTEAIVNEHGKMNDPWFCFRPWHIVKSQLQRYTRNCIKLPLDPS